MKIKDVRKCEDYIRNIGYYRLSGYLYPFLSEPKTNHIYKPDASFDAAISLYRFDKKLRMLLFNEIEKIEVAFRSAMANIVASSTRNPFWMTTPSVFANSSVFEHTMSLVDKEYRHSKEEFISHFKNTYANPYPPAWILVEILPLGVLTRIYENIADITLRKEIAMRFELPMPVFASWLTTLTLTRNSCGHHNRVWNKLNSIQPKKPKKLKRNWINNTTAVNRIFYNISIIKFFIDIISPTNDMKSHIIDFFTAYLMVDIRAMGFPPNW
ncbi:MAG: Abi family protein [Bacteroidales bacterium]|nr:Abi family protein [Bacteroidales bacterium]